MEVSDKERYRPEATPQDAMESFGLVGELLMGAMGRPNVVELPQYPPMMLVQRERPLDDVPVQRKRERPLEDVPVQRKRGNIEQGREIEPTFGCFETLPEDLRLRIWNLSLPGPRVVEISSQAPRHRSTPVILHVCSESRREALRSYTAFPLALASNPSKTVRAHVYVNFQIDTLYFNVKSFCTYLGPMSWSVSGYAHRIDQLMNKVRSIAIRLTALTGKPLHETVGMKRPLFHRFDELEKLAVVENDDGDGKIIDLDVRDEWQMALQTSGESDREEDYFYLRHDSKTDREKVESQLIKQYAVMKNGGISKKLKIQMVAMHIQMVVMHRETQNILDQPAQPPLLELAAMPPFL